VGRMIVTGLSAKLSQTALELARTRPKVLCSTVGVHPHNARTFDRQTQGELRALARSPEVVAIGECGLDYDRDFSPREAQRAAFEAQLELAATLEKPVFLHERSAHEDFLRIVQNARRTLVGGVVHCFTGGARELDCYLDLGLCIGITGFICDERRGTHLRSLVRRIPSSAALRPRSRSSSSASLNTPETDRSPALFGSNGRGRFADTGRICRSCERSRSFASTGKSMASSLVSRSFELRSTRPRATSPSSNRCHPLAVSFCAAPAG